MSLTDWYGPFEAILPAALGYIPLFDKIGDELQRESEETRKGIDVKGTILIEHWAKLANSFDEPKGDDLRTS